MGFSRTAGLLGSLGFLAGLTLPNASQAATFGDFVCTEQPGNVLRYECTAQTSADSARIEFWEDGTADYRYSRWSEVGTEHSWTIWGLKAGTTYQYRVEALGPPASESALVRSFTTDELGREFGPPFSGLEARVSTRPGATPWTEYVLANIECDTPNEYYIIFDVEGNVVWYEAPDSSRGVTALNYDFENQTVMGITGTILPHEIALDGTRVREVNYMDWFDCSNGPGPCPHHDVFRDSTSGITWVTTGRLDEVNFGPSGLDTCEDKNAYVVDGWDRLDDDWTTVEQTWELTTHFGYNPDVDMGPRYDPKSPVPKCKPGSWSGSLGWFNPETGSYEPPIDFSHVNAFHAEDPYLYISLFNWDQMIKVDPATNTIMWRLHGTDPAYSDFATPITIAPSIVANDTTIVSGHHHMITNPDGTFQFFNNQQFQEKYYARVARMELDTKTWVATMTEAFTMVDDDDGTYVNPEPLQCSQVGSGYNLGDGSRVLAPCAAQGYILELDQPDGTWSNGPVWSMHLTCDGMPVKVPSLYRAVPIPTLDPL